MTKKIIAATVLAAGMMLAASPTATKTTAAVVCFNLAKANATVGSSDNRTVQYTVNPGGDAGEIETEFNDAARVYQDLAGKVVVSMNSGEFRTYSATFYQMVDGKKKLISGNFKVVGATRVAFNVGKYDKSLPLQIDAQISGSRNTRG